MTRSLGRILLVLALMLGMAGPASADKVGGEFVITKDGLNSAVVRLTNGNFVVVFRGDSPNYKIAGQRYTNGGNKIGQAFTVVSASQEGAQPMVAALSGGGFAVAWDAADASGLGVFIQRYKPNGDKLGQRVRANVFTTGDQFDPTIAGLKDNRFVVVWTSIGQDGSDSASYGRRFDLDSAVGTEFRIDTSFPASFHHNPWVSSLPNGGFVVAYRGFNGTYVRRFNASGGGIADDAQVNEETESLLQRPVVAGLDNNGFVVAREVSGATRDIFAQRYNPNGTKAGGDTRVNASAAGEQFDPIAVGLTNGRYVIAWTDGTSERRALGRLFRPNGTAIGGNIKLNRTVVPIDAAPALGALNNGGFVATWQGSAQNAIFAVRGQRFDGEN